jgi:hypothetical protein
MSPMQQIFLGLGAVATKTYVDDVFSTFLYKGSSNSESGPSQAINNGINLSGEGGLVWLKSRTANNENCLTDTIMGAGKRLISESNGALSTNTQSVASFTSTGYTLPSGWNPAVNAGNQDYTSWTFRKAPGFFDVVTYTGNGSNQNISHSLGCVPGCIMVKRLDTAKDWCVYHRATGKSQHLELNNTDVAYTSTTRWNQTDPTASVFTVGDSSQTNANAATYVAYVFAGGESTAATARSVDFDGSGNEALTIPYSSDINLSTGDWTIECWAKPDDTDDGGGVLLSTGGGDGTKGYESCMFWLSDLTIEWYVTEASGGAGNFIHTAAVGSLKKGQWSHIAATREGNTFRFFLDGTLTKKFTSSSTLNAPQYPLHIGGRNGGSAYNGLVSNFRLVKGTAVYTSSFRPTYEPLTNITNTKILCCNNSSVTGSTVTSGTITSQGNATASTDSPFDDPAGFVFGESGSENVIKCGSYVGNGSSTGPEINLGWEPSWVMVKRTDSSNNWDILDSMRGFVSGDDDARLNPDLNYNEYQVQRAYLTPTGFGIESTSSAWNADGGNYVYIAIRRSDGYVGKPVELGTGVFAQAYGANSGDFRFTSNFPVDFAWAKLYAGSGNWWTSARLIQGREVKTNNNDAEQAGTNKKFDSNVSWHAPNADNTYISHMWKRHAGFDVVTWVGEKYSTRGNSSFTRKSSRDDVATWKIK